MKAPTRARHRAAVSKMLKHPNTRRICFFKAHFSLDGGKIPLSGLHRALKRAVVPAVPDLEGMGRAERDAKCKGFGMKHGQAVDTAVAQFCETGK